MKYKLSEILNIYKPEELDEFLKEKSNTTLNEKNLVYDDVKKYCKDIVCYYSDNDPYVKYDVEKTFADKLTDKQYVIKNGGHINAETGYTKFEEILKEI